MEFSISRSIEICTPPLHSESQPRELHRGAFSQKSRSRSVSPEFDLEDFSPSPKRFSSGKERISNPPPFLSSRSQSNSLLNLQSHSQELKIDSSVERETLQDPRIASRAMFLPNISPVSFPAKYHTHNPPDPHLSVSNNFFSVAQAQSHDRFAEIRRRAALVDLPDSGSESLSDGPCLNSESEDRVVEYQSDSGNTRLAGGLKIVGFPDFPSDSWTLDSDENVPNLVSDSLNLTSNELRNWSSSSMPSLGTDSDTEVPYLASASLPPEPSNLPGFDSVSLSVSVSVSETEDLPSLAVSDSEDMPSLNFDSSSGELPELSISDSMPALANSDDSMSDLANADYEMHLLNQISDSMPSLTSTNEMPQLNSDSDLPSLASHSSDDIDPPNFGADWYIDQIDSDSMMNSDWSSHSDSIPGLAENSDNSSMISPPASFTSEFSDSSLPPFQYSDEDSGSTILQDQAAEAGWVWPDNDALNDPVNHPFAMDFEEFNINPELFLALQLGFQPFLDFNEGFMNQQQQMAALSDGDSDSSYISMPPSLNSDSEEF